MGDSLSHLDDLLLPSEIEKMWHKVGKIEYLIFRPEITYSMLRIMISVLGSRVFTFLRKL